MRREIEILHITDNLSDADRVRREIEKVMPNAKVTYVSKKKTLLNHLKSKKYGLIIADYAVPGLVGLESLKLVRGSLKDSPVIYLSDSIGEEEVVELLKTGATDYVLKSNLKKLSIAILRALKEIDDRALVKRKEDEIRESNEFRASVLNALSTHIAVLDKNGLIVETNQVWDKYVNIHTEKNLQSISRGENYLEEILKIKMESNSELEYVHDAIIKVIEGEYKYFYHDYQCNNLQQEKWYTMRVTPRIDTKGAVIAHSNITERIQTEKKLRKSESEFKSLTENAPNVILKIGKNFEIEYINKNLFGLERKDIIGSSAFSHIYPKDKSFTRKKLSEVFKSGKSSYFVTTRTHDVENPITLGTYVGPVIGDKGTVQSLILIIRDMTEEIRDKELLKESEKRFRGIFEGMSEGILHVDPIGRIKSVNPGLCKMLGYSESELVGKICYDFLHDEATGKRLRKKMNYRKHGQSGQFETKFITKSGSELWTNISSQPDYNSNGEFIGVMSIIMDISERKKADLQAMKIKEAFTKALEHMVAERTEELENAQKELAVSLKKEKELGELKSRFVSMASHQFRTPLSVIQSSMGILDMQKENMGDSFKPVFERVYDRVKDQIEGMTDLMNEVLILGKINAGNIKVRFEETDIVELCNNITKSFADLNTDKKLVTEIKGKPIDVKIDSKLFEHALSNFISNALKYSPQNSTTKVKLAFNKHKVKIAVKDQGIGIPNDALPHLFVPFYRAANARDITGTGLGTSIAKEYIELIGGEVEVESEEGSGTEIMITFKNN